MKILPRYTLQELLKIKIIEEIKYQNYKFVKCGTKKYIKFNTIIKIRTNNIHSQNTTFCKNIELPKIQLRK